MSSVSLLQPCVGQVGRRAVLLPFATLVLSGLVLAGCGGTKGNRVSGAVTFKGAPLPAGKIYFSPDVTKQNKGMTGVADIKDGRYDTGQKGAQGTAGGPQVVRIEGFDASGTTVCVYDTTADLPQGASTKDFDVPESAGKNLPKPPAVLP